MPLTRTLAVTWVFLAIGLSPLKALAQETPPPPPPAAPEAEPPPPPPAPKKPTTIVVPLPKGEQEEGQGTAAGQPPPPPPPVAAPAAEPAPPPAPAAPEAERKVEATPTEVPPPPTLEPAPEEPPKTGGAYLDGHRREGAFLSGPGSLTFVLHHTFMLAAGGLATQIASHKFDFGTSSREAMLAGTLIGAGVGFGVSAWWQFNHWVDTPAANFGVINSLITGMALTGLVDLLSNDPTMLTWTALIGAEVGAWLTATLGGGEMPLSKGLFIASGGAWAVVYCALLLGILGASGTSSRAETAVDALLIAPGVGAGILSIAGLRYSPTSAQILRADLFGAGVGGVVLLLSALVLGRFDIATPYVLAMLSSAGAIAAVSIFWEEAAERPDVALTRDPAKDRPYSTVWW